MTVAALPPLAVYVHWPYCARICPYCDFNVVRDRGQAEQRALAEALITDLRSQAAMIRRKISRRSLQRRARHRLRVLSLKTKRLKLQQSNHVSKLNLPHNFVGSIPRRAHAAHAIPIVCFS